MLQETRCVNKISCRDRKHVVSTRYHEDELQTNKMPQNHAENACLSLTIFTTNLSYTGSNK